MADSFRCVAVRRRREAQNRKAKFWNERFSTVTVKGQTPISRMRSRRVGYVDYNFDVVCDIMATSPIQCITFSRREEEDTFLLVPYAMHS